MQACEWCASDEGGVVPVQGPLARGVKVGSSVRLAEGAKLKGGAARIACKTRMGQDKAQAAQVQRLFLPPPTCM